MGAIKHPQKTKNKMNTYANATSKKIGNLGSDAWVALDGRLTLRNQAIAAGKHFKKFWAVHPNYDGFDILRGSSLSTAKIIKSYGL